MRKHKRKKNKTKNQAPTSMIGRIVDLPLEDFIKELDRQKVNIGTMKNLILNLEGAYYELRTRKDGILKLILEGNSDNDPEVLKKSLEGLYAEMTKTEQKIVYLKQRAEELINVG